MIKFKSRDSGSTASLKVTEWYLKTTEDLDEESIIELAIVLLKSVNIDCTSIEERKIIRKLVSLRRGRNLTQADLARKIGCSDMWIVNLENSIDDDLKIGDLKKYCDALKVPFEVTFGAGII